MKLVNIIKYELNNNDLVYKYPTDEIKPGSQHIVYSGQTAFFINRNYSNQTSGLFAIIVGKISALTVLQYIIFF